MKKQSALQEVLSALENERDLELPMDPAFYENLHAKIMSRIERTETAAVTPLPMLGKKKRAHREHVHSWRSSKGSSNSGKD